MADNVTYKSVNEGPPGAIPRETVVETEQQAGGEHRQVVKVAEAPAIKGAFGASSSAEVRLDAATEVMMIIDYSHHEVHAGSHFLYTDAVLLASEAAQDYLITTPNTTKWAHMTFVLEGSAITQFELYEGADRDGTTPQTVGNSNRNSAVAATTTVHKGTSGGTTDGTRLHLYKSGSATQQSRSGGGTRNDDELILKQNTKYILRVTSGTNGNLTNVRMSWYEHTDRN
jgi:hypothetical protein